MLTQIGMAPVRVLTGWGTRTRARKPYWMGSLENEEQDI